MNNAANHRGVFHRRGCNAPQIAKLLAMTPIQSPSS